MDDPMGGVILILVLIAVNALIEAILTAVENVSEANARNRAEEGEKAAKRMVFLIEHHRRYITVTDITSILLLSGVAITYWTRVLPALQSMLLRSLEEQSVIIVLLTILFVVVSIMLLELLAFKLPKKASYKHAEKMAYFGAPILRCLMVLFAPVAFVVEAIAGGILGLFHIKASEPDENMTEEEIIYSVQEAQEAGIIEADEAEMIHNIFEFDEKEVNDIMTHRKNILAIDADMTIADAMSFMTEEPFSRYPVYEESIENIVGILHMKDVAAEYVLGGEEVKQKKVREIANEPYFVPDTQNLDVLFKDMQTKKVHMAIAIDEYGQTAGLITMEDILEEIVGDIQDEYDEEEEDIILNADGTWTVNGMVALEDVEEQTGLNVEEDDFETLNGFLISELDHIPADGEKATIFCNGYQIDILDTKNRMILQAKITKLPEEEKEEEE